ncbi:MAG: LamG domain-containing protein [Candidatus Poribacteria bacterium]
MKRLVLIIAFVMISTIFVASCFAIEASAILGLWLFDENKGNTVSDSSANGRNGVIKGDLKWVKGKVDSALQFPGQSGNYVMIPHDDGLNVKTFSVTAWVNLVNKGAYQALVEKSEVAGDVRNFYLAVTPEGLLYGGAKDKNGWNSILGEQIADEQWHHAAVTYDMKKILVYLDGKPYSKVAIGSEGGIEPLQNKGPITIGTTNDAGGEPVQGIIDEVGVFNRGLTEGEVKAIMQNSLKNAALAVNPIKKLSITWGNIKIF